MNKILPCPFCGSTDLVTSTSTEDREGTPACVMCESCGACGPSDYFKNKVDTKDLYIVAKSGWNDRVNLKK